MYVAYVALRLAGGAGERALGMSLVKSSFAVNRGRQQGIFMSLVGVSERRATTAKFGARQRIGQIPSDLGHHQS